MTAGLGDRLAADLRESGLIRPGESVVVALSGGRDSVTLLHLLRFALPPWRLELAAAHLDHRMRAGSAADADWVAGLCRAWGVPLARERAAEPPDSEASARDVRYRFLREAADEFGADYVATAHHADDQAETVLFRIARGTGLRGLAGIPRRRGPFVRPLLPFRRADLAEYVAAVGLRYREDPTNRETGPARNRLRHEILPALERVSPGASDALGRLAAHARDAEEGWRWLLDRLAEEAVVREDSGVVELARPRLLSYHSYVRARLIRRLLRGLGSAPGRAGTKAALEFIRFGESGHYVDVRGGVRVARDFDRIRLLRSASHEECGPPPDRPLVIEGAEAGEGEAVIGGRHFAARWAIGDGDAIEPGAAFGLGALHFPLELRGWRAGDRIRLEYGGKKVAKLFGERRLPRHERGRVPVLAETTGRILWIPGHARATGLEAASAERAFYIAVEHVEQH